jgi:hypothetical protein
MLVGNDNDMTLVILPPSCSNEGCDIVILIHYVFLFGKYMLILDALYNKAERANVNVYYSFSIKL